MTLPARLAEKGIPFTIFEAASEVGGTWHHNSYPGAACDVWTSLYQFSFFQNPEWSRCSRQHRASRFGIVSPMGLKLSHQNVQLFLRGVRHT